VLNFGAKTLKIIGSIFHRTISQIENKPAN
jgi:hypothetical protein